MRSLVWSLLVLVACSSDDDTSPGGAANPTLDRTKTISAAGEADLPLVCDAWAEVVGGYGQPDKKKDCGNALASTYPPKSQSECVASMKSQTVEDCTAKIDSFLKCQEATYANPCVTLGEAPGCAALYGKSCWR